MSDQDSTKASTLQRPLTDDREAWQAYWEEQGQPWRTEPEIDTERQAELSKFRNTTPNIEKGIYPFRLKNNESKLTRADVEWLLATHENGRGPVNWSDKSQQKRIGLDLRGADLSSMELRNLPLARMRGGPSGGNAKEMRSWRSATAEQREMALISLERANLAEAYLERANLSQGNLKNAHFIGAHLEGANLSGATFSGANLSKAYLSGTHLTEAHLEGADLSRARLRGSVPDIDWRRIAGESNNASRNIARQTSSIYHGPHGLLLICEVLFLIAPLVLKG